MLEAVAAAAATALISTGSAAALAAARRSGETRDAVLVLTSKVQAVETLLTQYTVDHRALFVRVETLDVQVANLTSRVSAIENGVIDRRHGIE